MRHIKSYRALLSILVLGVTTFMANAENSTRSRHLIPSNLRCEYQVNPLGIDTLQPRLSWTVESAQRSQVQIAYQIQVATDIEILMKNKANLWDSGKIESNHTIQVEYQGPSLQSRMRCFWRVRVWDKKGKASRWSKPAWWEMGLLEAGDWTGIWINDGKPNPKQDEEFYNEDPAPLFRKEFSIDKPVAEARLYISGLGYYEAALNGEQIGDHGLDPGWTSYSKRVLYSVYDITPQIQKGTNCFGVMLGNGWYNPVPMRMWGRLNLREHLTIGRPRLIAQLEVEYLDGTRKTIATDENWQVTGGPILKNNIYLGEVYDARKEILGWNRSGFDDSKWESASKAVEPVGPLCASVQPPIKITATVAPVAITKPTKGVYIFDLGQNFAGWARLRVKGPAGTTVKMRFGELLHPDGTLNEMTSVAGQLKYGQGGSGAPSIACQSDTYILKGEGKEVYTPRFTFHGFRYVEVTGYPGHPSLQAIEGLRLSAAVPQVGSFECSNKNLNRIQEMVEWTFLSNLFSVQSDCPHREKFGYGGDIVTSGEAFLDNFDMAGFYSKAISDLADAAREGFLFTETAPFVGIADDGFGRDSGPIGWALAFTFLQSKLYQYYGDQRVIEEHYETARKYVDFIRAQADGFIINRGIGDHESLDPKSVELTSTAFYYHHALLVSQLASVLGKEEEAQQYADLAEKIKEAFIARFLEPGTGHFGPGTQACQAFALHYDFVPPAEHSKTLDCLLKEVQDRHQGHLATGIFGTRYLLSTLSDCGHADVACNIVLQEDFPGWIHMMNKGATTLWEHWEFSDNVYSHNHPMFGSVSAWFYESLAGIRPQDDAVGYDRILIKPQPVEGLKWVKAYYDSIRGRIRSEWRIKGNNFFMNLTIPANTTATVCLPTTEPDSVRESGKPIREVKEVHFRGQEDENVIYEVGSGAYSFTCRRND